MASAATISLLDSMEAHLVLPVHLEIMRANTFPEDAEVQMVMAKGVLQAAMTISLRAIAGLDLHIPPSLEDLVKSDMQGLLHQTQLAPALPRESESVMDTGPTELQTPSGDVQHPAVEKSRSHPNLKLCSAPGPSISQDHAIRMGNWWKAQMGDATPPCPPEILDLLQFVQQIFQENDRYLRQEMVLAVKHKMEADANVRGIKRKINEWRAHVEEQQHPAVLAVPAYEGPSLDELAKKLPAQRDKSILEYLKGVQAHMLHVDKQLAYEMQVRVNMLRGIDIIARIWDLEKEPVLL
ncbi:hypothetical protein AcW1_010286 [Taiwanofungus camphoratus]|nr:hypothetical protein AcW1_010286 [Antrodia cinnamomea]